MSIARISHTLKKQGASIAVNDDLISHRSQELEVLPESVWVDIECKDKRNILIANTYAQTQCDHAVVCSGFKQLETMLSDRKQEVIMLT